MSVGGGPAGLYLAILLKQLDPGSQLESMEWFEKGARYLRQPPPQYLAARPRSR